MAMLSKELVVKEKDLAVASVKADGVSEAKLLFRNFLLKLQLILLFSSRL